MSHPRITTAGFLACFAILAFACAKASSGPEPLTIQPPDEPSTKVPSEAARDADVDGAAPDGGGGDAETPGECEGQETQSSCADCCGKAHEQGYAVFLAALFECACQPEICRTQCTPALCPDTTAEPDATCRACIAEHEQDCNNAITQGCSANESCLAFNECIIQSKCTSKPNSQ
jgi:hypothetical protein